MHCHIGQFGTVVAVLFVTKSSEAQRAEPNFQWAVACHKHIQTEIEFLGADQQRLVNVPTDNVRLLLALLLVVLIVSPFLNLF